MTVKAMDHFTVLTADLPTTQDFYESVLGLKVGWRPPLGFPGIWLYAGDRAVLHIVSGREMPADPAGVLDHMAYSAEGLRATLQKLAKRKIRYDLRRQPESKVWQLFFFDPNGARVELDFAAEEAGPEA